MANVIIGTAGHIDHGKTTLIKRLTGIETDRLSEEKKRGITIELGFAYFDLPSGKRAGIVDVPGHEKFIKNMLAGAGGIDIVILIVSGEEGFMPQTQEHFDILTLLGVDHGIVAITKSDLVDSDWLDAVEEEVRERVKGSFLEKAPIVRVSSHTGMGFDELTKTIDKMADELEEKNDLSAPRLPIDRVFSMTGFGTVVTGTLIEGKINEGDVLELYPSNKEARVRKIQVHSQDVKTAYSGQRVAINLANLSRSDISRGDILAKPGSLQDSSMLDARIKILGSYSRVVNNWQRLRLYHGSREVLCRLVLLESESLSGGDEAFVQLRLEEATACKYGDKFVLRLFSPLETIGGGVILDPNALKHKRFKEDIIDQLISKSGGDKNEILISTIHKRNKDFGTANALANDSGLSLAEVEEIINSLRETGEIVELSGKIFTHMSVVSAIEDEIIQHLNNYHVKNPLRAGAQKEEIRSKLISGIKGKAYDDLLAVIASNDSIVIKGNICSLKEFRVEPAADQKKKLESFLAILDKAEFNPPSFDEILKSSGINQNEKALIEYIQGLDDFVKLGENLYISKKAYSKAKNLILEHFEKKESLVLSDFRDMIGSSRKIAVPLLELFDKEKVTIRKDDIRIKA